MEKTLELLDRTSKEAGRFYVYLYKDVRPGKEGVPIYVGKGTGNRAGFHWTGSRINRNLSEVLREIKSSGLVPIVEILARFQTEDEAFQYERNTIVGLGRVELGTGPLCNLSDGGEGPIGHRHSSETLRKIGEASTKMHRDPILAARRAERISETLSRPEAKAARSAFMKEVHARHGSKESRIRSQKVTYATQAYKDKQSAATREMQKRPEVKAAHAAGLRRRHAVPGAREQVGATSKARHSDPEIKAKHKAAMAAFRARPDVIEKYKAFYEARRRSRALAD